MISLFLSHSLYCFLATFFFPTEKFLFIRNFRTRPSLFPLSLSPFFPFPFSPSRLTLAAALQLSTTHAPPSLSSFSVCATTTSPALPPSPPSPSSTNGQPSSPWRVFALLPRGVYTCASWSPPRARARIPVSRPPALRCRRPSPVARRPRPR